MSATTQVSKMSRQEKLSAIRNKNQEVIKQITMADFEEGGRLNRQQFATFYQQVFETADVLDMVRSVPVDGPESQIDKIGLDRYILQPVGEAEDVDATTINDGKIDIDVTEAGFGYELSRRTVEDTIERENTAEIILDMHSERFGTDLEHLAFRGDETYENVDEPTYESFLSQNDGWLVKAEEEGANTSDHASTIDNDVFFDAIYGVEDRFLRATDPVFFGHPKQLTAYRQYLTERETPLGDESVVDRGMPTPSGYPFVPTTAMPPDQIMFTDPNNLLYTPHREMFVDVTTEGKDVVFKRLFAIYAMSARFDFVVEEGSAVSIIKDIAVPTGVEEHPHQDDL